MYPVERSLVEKFAGRPFALVGVNSDANVDRIQPVLVSENITWRSFRNGTMDAPESIAAHWNVSGWPSMFLIDADGILQKEPPRDELAEAIEALVQKAE